jgi:hypothetical protein
MTRIPWSPVPSRRAFCWASTTPPTESSSDAAAIRLPLQLLISEKDWVVQRAPQDRFFDRSWARRSRSATCSPDSSTTRSVSAIASSPSTRSAPSSKAHVPQSRRRPTRCCRRTATVTPATRKSVSAGRYRPAPRRGLNFALTRLAMRTLGRLSDGIRIGLTTGFDSGSSLDYVYLNQACGATADRQADRSRLPRFDRLARRACAENPPAARIARQLQTILRGKRPDAAHRRSRRRPWTLRAGRRRATAGAPAIDRPA